MQRGLLECFCVCVCVCVCVYTVYKSVCKVTVFEDFILSSTLTLGTDQPLENVLLISLQPCLWPTWSPILMNTMRFQFTLPRHPGKDLVSPLFAATLDD